MNDHDTSAPVQLSETDAITLALRPYTRPVRLRQHELVAVVADSGLSLRPHPGGGPREPKSRAGPDSRLARDLAKTARRCETVTVLVTVEPQTRRGRLAST